jgi:predicted N-formylglutamate amidohydrolase
MNLTRQISGRGLCIGTDDFHTGNGLIAAARTAFESLTSVTLNEPFRGTYVPLEFYGRDARVQSLMLEIRKDTYGFGAVASAEFENKARALDEFVRELNEVQPVVTTCVATGNEMQQAPTITREQKNL